MLLFVVIENKLNVNHAYIFVY